VPLVQDLVEDTSTGKSVKESREALCSRQKGQRKKEGKGRKATHFRQIVDEDVEQFTCAVVVLGEGEDCLLWLLGDDLAFVGDLRKEED
jgi:hypothetical protein